jgi:hypothetical protein
MDQMSDFDNVFLHFNKLKDEIFSLYSTSRFLDQKYVRSTLSYLDGFYKTINDVRAARREFQYPCEAGGTGHVVIKGLRN